jgi:hypothetical protein
MGSQISAFVLGFRESSLFPSCDVTLSACPFVHCLAAEDKGGRLQCRPLHLFVRACCSLSFIVQSVPSELRRHQQYLLALEFLDTHQQLGPLFWRDFLRLEPEQSTLKRMDPIL